MSDMFAYQQAAKSTAVFPHDVAASYLPLQLAAEAGEVAGKFGKALRKGTRVDAEAVAHELGDVLWYVAVMADYLGYDLKEIADMNLDKLRDRNDRGTIHGDGDKR
jgi:NTP pyrophosphatase (non-canonical NTP hydrolase)